MPAEKIVIVGAGPVGSLAALYAAQRGYNVELYELRPGTYKTRLHNHQLFSSRARVPDNDSMCHGRIMFLLERFPVFNIAPIFTMNALHTSRLYTST